MAIKKENTPLDKKSFYKGIVLGTLIASSLSMIFYPSRSCPPAAKPLDVPENSLPDQRAKKTEFDPNRNVILVKPHGRVKGASFG